MHLSALDNVLWAAGLVGHAALLFVLIFRGRWRTFPVFTSMIAYQILATLVLLFVRRTGDAETYAVAYWGTTVPDYALQLGLLYEIAKVVLRPTGTWVMDAKRSFLLWSGLGVLAAAVAAWMVVPGTSATLSPLEVRSVLFTSLLTCEVFLAMIAAANRLALPWRSHVMALGQGLTMWALIALAGDAAHILLGWNRESAMLDELRMMIYLGALGFWTVAFWIPERERAPLPPDMHEYIVALHRRVQYDLDRLAESKRPYL